MVSSSTCRLRPPDWLFSYFLFFFVRTGKLLLVWKYETQSEPLTPLSLHSVHSEKLELHEPQCNCRHWVQREEPWSVSQPIVREHDLFCSYTPLLCREFGMPGTLQLDKLLGGTSGPAYNVVSWPLTHPHFEQSLSVSSPPLLYLTASPTCSPF